MGSTRGGYETRGTKVCVDLPPKFTLEPFFLVWSLTLPLPLYGPFVCCCLARFTPLTCLLTDYEHCQVECTIESIDAIKHNGIS